MKIDVSPTKGEKKDSSSSGVAMESVTPGSRRGGAATADQVELPGVVLGDAGVTGGVGAVGRRGGGKQGPRQGSVGTGRDPPWCSAGDKGRARREEVGEGGLGLREEDARRWRPCEGGERTTADEGV
jgi:hypothetical protein